MSAKKSTVLCLDVVILAASKGKLLDRFFQLLSIHRSSVV